MLVTLSKRRFRCLIVRVGKFSPLVMLDHIAEQVWVNVGVIADFAPRPSTCYDQLTAIKARFGLTYLS